MTESEAVPRELVRRIAREYLEKMDRDSLEEFDVVFSSTYAELMRAPEDAEPGADWRESGFPLDATFLDGTLVSSLIWATATLVREVSLRRGQPELAEHLASFERRLAEATTRQQPGIDAAALREQIVAAINEREGWSPSDAAGAGVFTAEGVDFELIVRRVGSSPEWVIAFSLRAADPRFDLDRTPFGTVRLGMNPQRYIEDLFKDIEGLPAETREERSEALDVLEAIGGQLASRLLPPPLQERLWELGERGGSLLIQSDEPWIPWELVKLQLQRAGRKQISPFLCERFALTRWIRGKSFTRLLPLRHLGVVAPRDSGLEDARGELEDLLALAKVPERQVSEIEGRRSEVLEQVASGELDGLHFASHGDAGRHNADRAELSLEGGGRIRPGELYGRAIGLEQSRPLVFLNACRSARGGLALAGAGGWAKGFLDAGAGAFVGTFWEVPDRKAREFARTFYERFLGGTPIGEALRQTRLAIRDRYPGHPAWLAYTAFAHPAAVCTSEGGTKGFGEA